MPKLKSPILLPIASALAIYALPYHAVAAAASSSTSTSSSSSSSSSSGEETADCDQARAADEGAQRAEERIDGAMDELIGKSDAAEKCIGSITEIMPKFEQFSDLNFDGLLDKLKEEICKLASDVVRGAVNKTNDEIDDILNSIIGNITLPDGTTINPVDTVMPQKPGIGYTSPGSSSSSGTSSSGTSPTTTSNGTIYTPADPSTGSPASITYTDVNKKPVTITADQLTGGSYTFDAGNGVIGVFTPGGPYSEYAGSIVYLGGGYGGQVKKGFEPKPDGRMYSPHPNPWAGIAIKSNSSAALSSDASSSDTSWWNNIWK